MSSATSHRAAAFEPDANIEATRKTVPKPNLRVLQVFNCLSMGGAETWLMALLKYFQQANDEGNEDLPLRVQTDILLTSGAKGMFDGEAEALGSRLFYCHFTRRHPLWFTNQFRRILDEGRYDAIHDHQDYAAGFRFMMGLGHLPPVRVAHVHNTSFSIDNYKSSAARWLTFQAARRSLARMATHVTSTSREMLTDFGFDSPLFEQIRPRVVHCGFDVSSFRGENRLVHRQLTEEFGWSDDSKVVLFVGRLDEPVGNGLHRKNPAFALEVARECISQDPHVRMIMAGSGPEMKAKLEANVKEWGLDDKIRLTGIYPDVTRLMLGSDLFLFPSLAEGLGMVVVEAQAAGLRVLTSEGVPRESMVIAENVDFRPLEAGVAFWADESLRLLNMERPDPAACNLAVRKSPFSIQNSARALVNIYSGVEN